MKDKSTCYPINRLLYSLLFGVLVLASCEDNYMYDKEEPSWLGESIYDYLRNDGNFTTYLRLIDDLDYGQVLSLTGSKTLFAADNNAFNEFFNNNDWGVSSYEELTTAQKKLLFNYSMINNAYLLEKLPNYFYNNFTYEGQAMRRPTALSAIDSIPYETGDQLPAGTEWSYYRQNGIHVVKDETDRPIVFFSQPFIEKNSITNEDFSFITGGKTWNRDDFYVFNKKVVKGDIVCKNGYIHILDGVLTPPLNIAEYIGENPNTTQFSRLLDRFSRPTFQSSLTATYRELNPSFGDSIFSKNYYASLGGATVTPEGNNAPYLLPFNPGWNMYRVTSGGSIYPDMAAMFVPTDETMRDYFTNDPGGILLRERYGEWDDVPDDIALSFLRRHMRMSFVESVPSRFDQMVDEENYRLPVTTQDILTDQNYTAVNGQVYLTNKVYTPVDFISVYGPILLSEDTKILNWAIARTVTANDVEFAFYKLYLNSLVVNYGVFIPTDEYLSRYIDPFAYGQTGTQGVLKYWFNEETSAVNATIYTYSKVTGVVGDSVGVIRDGNFLENRLQKLLDSHIVVNDISGDGYYITKSNDIIKVTGNRVQGGANINDGTYVEVQKTYNQENGTTYILNAPLESSLRSVYDILGDQEKQPFNAFFQLLSDIPDEWPDSIPSIFYDQTAGAGGTIDYTIRFFNAYNYTVYVPSNAAIQDAMDKGILKSWDEINNIPEEDKRKAATERMVRILRYHFQDNALFTQSNPGGNLYQSATLRSEKDESDPLFGTIPNKYYKIKVENSGQTLRLTTESGGTANVLLTPGYYDLVAKEYIFTGNPDSHKNVDGSGASTATGSFGSNTTYISTSSSAVVHLIDNVLTFDNETF